TVGHSSSRTPTALMGLRRGPGGGRRDDSSSSGGETENALRKTPGTGDGDEESQSGRNEGAPGVTGGGGDVRGRGEVVGGAARRKEKKEAEGSAAFMENDS
ncbi:unnamed protein product, partial [Ectocarpus sp. 12 AP-2014]